MARPSSFRDYSNAALALAWALATAALLIRIYPPAGIPGALCLIIAALCIPAAFRLVFSHRLPLKPVAAVLAAAATATAALLAVIALYYAGFDFVLTESDLNAVFQSYPGEMLEYSLVNFISPGAIAAGAAALLGSAFIFYRLSKNAGPASLSENRRALALLAIFALTGLFYCALTRTDLYKFYQSSRQSYYTNLKIFNNQLSELLKDKAWLNPEQRPHNDELHVLIIGESASRDFMHAYGGPLDNTPWLDEFKHSPGVVFFTKAYSTFPNTMISLREALTDGRAYTGSTFPFGQNLVTQFRQNSFHTAWFSNQKQLGHFDNLVSAMAYTADLTAFTVNRHDVSDRYDQIPYDAKLVAMVKDYMGGHEFQNNEFIVINLIGSHQPYKYRTPGDYPFEADLPAGAVGQAKKFGLAEYLDYNKSIKYTDQEVLKELFTLFQSYKDRAITVTYFSDHGEAWLGKGLTQGGHVNTGPMFQWSMVTIPFFTWMSEAYIERYPDKYSNAGNNADKIFTNDLMFDYFAGLADLKTANRRPEYDISDAAYSLTREKARLLDKVFISDDPARIMEKNLAELKNRPDLPALAAHLCNSSFMAGQLRGQGADKYEIDLWLPTKKGAPEKLFVGHDPGSLGFDLETYLLNTPPDFEFLWLDIKSLNKNNADLIFKILTELDAKYDLKRRVLIESLYVEALEIFSRDGWNTSYYLDWNSLLAAHKAGDAPKAEKTALKFAADIKKYGVGGIGYDLSADEAVKQWLKPQLPENIKIYSWSMDKYYSSPDLIEFLESNRHLTLILIEFETHYPAAT